MTCQEKLQTPQWLKKREPLLNERGQKCQTCGADSGSTKLTIHHGYFMPKGNPWNYENTTLWVLCWPCHERVQKTLTEIHRIIGRFHPDEYLEIKKRVGDSVFELEFGITAQEAEEILREDREAEAHQYAEYSVSIISSNELGLSRAYELENSLLLRLAGIDVSVSTLPGERDAVATVSGPDNEVVSLIQAWCDKWSN